MTLSLRIKLFIVSTLIIVGGQVAFTYKNVLSFQQSYIDTLKYKSKSLGNYLKKDVEYILNFGVPLSKLIKLENTLQDILTNVKEIKYIEITDLKKNLLYYADHKKMSRIKLGETNSKFYDQKEILNIIGYGLTTKDTDIIIPIFYNKKKIKKGYINIRLAPEHIKAKSRQILFDMITVIMTSLLLTFEFLTFFISYSVNLPLENMNKKLGDSVKTISTIPVTKYIFFTELSDIINKFNIIIFSYQKRLIHMKKINQMLPELKKNFKEITNSQRKKIKSIISSDSDKKNKEKEILLAKLYNSIIRIESLFITFELKISKFSDSLAQGMPEQIFAVKKIRLPFSFIRPVIFLFIMADGFSISFLPLFVENLYKPIFNLPKELVIGIPISVFMLFLAITMPFAGRISDKIGWNRSLIAGLFINASGLILTGFVKDIYMLILYRSITAIGFGIVFISCQKFIIDTTTPATRSLGMASFLSAFFSGDICGTVIGGMLADRIGYNIIFFISGAFSILALLAIILIFPNNNHKQKSELPFAIKNLFLVFKDRDFLCTLFLQAIPAKLTLIGFLFYFIPVYLKKIDVIQSDIGRVIMCYSIAIIFIGPLFSRFIEKPEYRKKYILSGGVITGLSLLSFLWFDGIKAVIFIASMLGIAQAISVSSQAALISETKTVKKLGQGAGMGIFRFWERIGNVLGPLLIGLLISVSGYRHAVIYTGIISLAGSLLYFLNMIISTRKKIYK